MDVGWRLCVVSSILSPVEILLLMLYQRLWQWAVFSCWCVALWKLSEDDRERGEARKQWLRRVTNTAETGTSAIEPVYRTVFAALRQVQLRFLHTSCPVWRRRIMFSPITPVCVFLSTLLYTKRLISHLPGPVVFITTVTAIYSLGHGLCTLTAVPRSTQPSTLRVTVKWLSAYELSNNNKWRWCLRMAAANLSADSQPKSVGLVWGLAPGGHPALSLHSSNEPGELSQWLCHDDSTINIVLVIIVVILILK